MNFQLHVPTGGLGRSRTLAEGGNWVTTPMATQHFRRVDRLLSELYRLMAPC